MENWIRNQMASAFMPRMATGPYDKKLRAFSAPFLSLIHTTDSQQLSTHCGVLEFSAEEGRCYLPQWIMVQLQLKEGDAIDVEIAHLPKAKYAKLKPQNLEFIDISNPRAMLELRKFACLTKKDHIRVLYNDLPLDFIIVDLKPKNAVCIVDCDVDLEFDAPEGYVEPKANVRPSGVAVKPAPPPLPVAPIGPTSSGFNVGGVKLSGKASTPLTSECEEQGTGQEYIPDAFCYEDYVPGHISFMRYDYKCREKQVKDLAEKQKVKKVDGSFAFTGQGRSVKAVRS